MRSGSLRFPGVLVQGRENWQNWWPWAADPGRLFRRPCQAKSQCTSLDTPFYPVHWGLACCPAGCLLCSERVVTRPGTAQPKSRISANGEYPMLHTSGWASAGNTKP